MGRWARLFVLASALLAGLTAATNASAEAPPTTEVASRPNRAMVVMGVLALVGGYTPAALVAAKSPIYSDNSLYVPVLGPWLDVADRPKCGPGSVRCGVETGNQALLVLDGVFQAWGVAAILVGLFSKEYVQSRPASASSGGGGGGGGGAVAFAVRRLHLAPARLGVGGYGLGAFGSF